MNIRKMIGGSIVCALLGSAPAAVSGESLYWRESLGVGSGSLIKRSDPEYSCPAKEVKQDSPDMGR